MRNNIHQVILDQVITVLKKKETKHEYYTLISQKLYFIVKNTSIEKLLYKKYKNKAELI